MGLFITVIDLLSDLHIESNQLVFRQTVVCQEFLNLVVDILSNIGVVAVLELELVDEHALELLTLLDLY